jgi:Rrf2 family protein
MSDGVESALHTCLTLAWLGDDQPVPSARLAEVHDLGPAYLNKHLQALSRAGIVASSPGPAGGFRLARSPDRITLMDVVAAIEGSDDAFRCAEIRRRGLQAHLPDRQFRRPCAIATAMRTAELAWRKALAAQTLADVMATAERNSPGGPERLRKWRATF